MRTYLLACAAAALAGGAMALWTEVDSAAAPASAATLRARAPAESHAPSRYREAMAHRHAHPWLLRAMSAREADGTLTPVPDEPPAPPPSL